MRTEMRKRIVALRNFANAPKKKSQTLYSQSAELVKLLEFSVGSDVTACHLVENTNKELTK